MGGLGDAKVIGKSLFLVAGCRDKPRRPSLGPPPRSGFVQVGVYNLFPFSLQPTRSAEIGGLDAPLKSRYRPPLAPRLGNGLLDPALQVARASEDLVLPLSEAAFGDADVIAVVLVEETVDGVRHNVLGFFFVAPTFKIRNKKNRSKKTNISYGFCPVC